MAEQNAEALGTCADSRRDVQWELSDVLMDVVPIKFPWNKQQNKVVRTDF